MFSRTVRAVAAVAALDGGGAVDVVAERAAVEERLQVGADVVEVDLLLRLDDRVADVGGLHEDQRVVLVDRVADGDRDLPHDAAESRVDQVLHLEGAHHEEQLALADLIADGDLDLDHGALQRRADRVGVGRTEDLRGGGRPRPARALALAEEVERGERVARVELRARARDAVAGGRAGVGPIDGREGRDVVVDPAGVDGAVGEVGVGEDVAQEADVRLRAADLELVEGAQGALDGRAEVGRGRGGDHLAQQRVEVGVGGVAGVAVGIDADAGARGGLEDGEHPAGRPHRAVGLHLLQVDARLDGVAARRGHRLLREPDAVEGRAAGDAKLRLHEVDPGHLLRHGVLDLQAGVGLDEDEAIVRRRVDEELERAQAAVIDGPRHAHGRRRDAGAERLAQLRAGRDLDDLLVAALHAALALAQVADAAAAVADDLDLDVARAGDQLLHVDRVVAEGGLGLGAAAGVGLGDGAGLLDDPHPAAAAARHGLDHHRAAGAQPGQKSGRLVLADGAGAAGEHRHVVLLGQRAGAGLVAEELQRLDAGPDEDDALLRAAPREAGVLGQEAVAGVQRVAAGRLGRRDHSLDVEVGGRPDALQGAGLVGRADVQRGGVVGRVDGDGRDIQLRRRPRDADGDLAAVGDQQFVQTHTLALVSGSPGRSRARSSSGGPRDATGRRAYHDRRHDGRAAPATYSQGPGRRSRCCAQG